MEKHEKQLKKGSISVLDLLGPKGIDIWYREYLREIQIGHKGTRHHLCVRKRTDGHCHVFLVVHLDQIF